MYLAVFIFLIIIIIIGLILSRQSGIDGKKLHINYRNYDKLMIVAHPDDESLWGYHYLKNYNGWKIICITNANNPVRVKELTKISNIFQTDLEIWNYEDNQYTYNMDPKIYEDISRAINNDKNIKLVVTHNPLGEYGHIQHIKISNVVLTVSKKPVYVFSYSSEKINMNDEKCKLKNVYESQKKIFEEHCVKNIQQRLVRLI